MRRALLAQRTVMDTIGHNVANATTPGYTKQQVILTPTNPFPYPSVSSLFGGGQIGTGVMVEQIRRIRDEFVDKQLRLGYMNKGQNDVEQSTLQQVENIFMEPATSEGMSKALSNFFTQWQELSKRPDNTAVRQQLLSSGQEIVDVAHQIDQSMRELRVNLNGQLQKDITEVNRITHEIGHLNHEIAKVTTAGEAPNDLMDKRDMLLDELAKYVDFTTFTTEANQIGVNVGSRELIRDQFVYDVSDELEWDHPSQNSQTPYFSDVSQQDFFMLMNNSKGELKGLLNSRDMIVPGVQEKFQEFLASIADGVNTMHSAGMGVNLPDMNSVYTTNSAITGTTNFVSILPATLEGLSVGETLRIEDATTQDAVTVKITNLDTQNGRIYFDPVGPMAKTVQTGAGTWASQAVTIAAGANIRIIDSPKFNFFTSDSVLPNNFVGDTTPAYKSERVSVINVPDSITMQSTVADLESAFGVDISDIFGKTLNLDDLATTPLITEGMTLQAVFSRISAMRTVANGEQPLGITLDTVNHRIVMTGQTRDSLEELGGVNGSQMNLLRILGLEGQGITGLAMQTGSNLSSTLSSLGIASGWIQIDNATIAVDTNKTVQQTLDDINAALNTAGSNSVGTNIYFDPTARTLRIVSTHQFSTDTALVPNPLPYAGAPVTTSNFLTVFGLQRQEGAPTDSTVQALSSVTSSDIGARIKVNASLLQDPNRIASTFSLAGIPGDNSAALAIAAVQNTYLMNNTSSGFTANPTETLDTNFNNMIAKLGTDSQRAIVDGEVNQRFVEYYTNKQQEVSGVSLDEEMTRMIESQQSFNAASRMVNTVDEMLDKIINGMGTVGR